MDVVLAECGAPRLLPSLKRESPHFKGRMLLFLVGHAWGTIRMQDPSMTSVASMVHKWIEQTPAHCT
eukprot:1892504-Prymnesium_polylepis.1